MLQNEINDYITLKLENDKTVIYIKDIKFMTCKRLIINVPKNKLEIYENAESIDEIVEENKMYLSNNQIYEEAEQGLIIEMKHHHYMIKPEEEFWGHCSNLQAWAENNYDTRLLRYNLAFHLLKRLTEFGDPIAKRVFKEEIAKRLESGHQPTVQYLFTENFVKDCLTNDEILSILLEPNDYNALIEALPNHYMNLSFQVGKFNNRNRIKDKINLAIVNKRIIELLIDDLNLGIFPESLTKLTVLEKLWISFNNIKTIPKSIKNLKSLKVLDVGGNLLSDIPDSIIELPNLVELGISGNIIKEIPQS